MAADEDARLRLKLVRAFSVNVPHNKALGMRIVDMKPKEALFELPYSEKLVGNPDTGVIHGGAITALLDGASGAAVFAALEDFVPIATLDLRIDYLRPAEAGRAVLAKATCYKLAKNVAFTRAVAYHDDPEDPIAHSVGTFMLSTKVGNIQS
ncbi:MAG: PaaI family thioesterase [Deltaproteobacteria bacterium]|nr:PaaI family thioesterase [Deltaproteobacteria bacterium]